MSCSSLRISSVLRAHCRHGNSGPPPLPTLPRKEEGACPPCSHHKRSQLALHLAAEAVDDALAGERDQLDVAGLPRLEPHRGAGRDIEPHAARLLPLELQRRIGLAEMVMRPTLHPAVPR